MRHETGGNADEKRSRARRDGRFGLEVLGKNGLRAKLLSQDPATGAGTRYVDIPQNWKGGGIAHYHPDYEEVFVIEGDVSLTGRDYLGDGSYIYRPSGIVHGHDEQAKKGCFCIIRFGGPLELCFVHEPDGRG